MAWSVGSKSLLCLGLFVVASSFCSCSPLTRLKALDKSKENSMISRGSGLHHGRLLIGQNSLQGAKVKAIGTSMELLDLDADYQADIGWAEPKQAKGQGDDSSSPKPGEAVVDQLLKLEPKVECTGDSMKLQIQGAASTPGSLFFVDRGSNLSPLPLSKLPQSCGYTIQSTRRDFVLVAPYDGCFVAHEEDCYVLPLRWCGLPVRMSCPLMRPSAPNPPMVTCHSEGMVVKTDWMISVAKIKVNLNDVWEPLMKASAKCGFSIVVHPDGVVISVPYAPCLKKKDGLYTLELYGDGETKISCPSLSATEPEPTKSPPKYPELQTEVPSKGVHPLTPSHNSGSPPDQTFAQNPEVPYYPSYPHYFYPYPDLKPVTTAQPLSSPLSKTTEVQSKQTAPEGQMPQKFQPFYVWPSQPEQVPVEKETPVDSSATQRPNEKVENPFYHYPHNFQHPNFIPVQTPENPATQSPVTKPPPGKFPEYVLPNYYPSGPTQKHQEPTSSKPENQEYKPQLVPPVSQGQIYQPFYPNPFYSPLWPQGPYQPQMPTPTLAPKGHVNPATQSQVTKPPPGKFPEYVLPNYYPSGPTQKPQEPTSSKPENQEYKPQPVPPVSQERQGQIYQPFYPNPFYTPLWPQGPYQPQMPTPTLAPKGQVNPDTQSPVTKPPPGKFPEYVLPNYYPSGPTQKPQEPTSRKPENQEYKPQPVPPVSQERQGQIYQPFYPNPFYTPLWPQGPYQPQMPTPTLAPKGQVNPDTQSPVTKPPPGKFPEYVLPNYYPSGPTQKPQEPTSSKPENQEYKPQPVPPVSQEPQGQIYQPFYPNPFYTPLWPQGPYQPQMPTPTLAPKGQVNPGTSNPQIPGKLSPSKPPSAPQSKLPSQPEAPAGEVQQQLYPYFYQPEPEKQPDEKPQPSQEPGAKPAVNPPEGNVYYPFNPYYPQQPQQIMLPPTTSTQRPQPNKGPSNGGNVHQGPQPGSPYMPPFYCPQFCPSGISNCCPQIAFHQHMHHFVPAGLGSKNAPLVYPVMPYLSSLGYSGIDRGLADPSPEQTVSTTATSATALQQALPPPNEQLPYLLPPDGVSIPINQMPTYPYFVPNLYLQQNLPQSQSAVNYNAPSRPQAPGNWQGNPHYIQSQLSQLQLLANQQRVPRATELKPSNVKTSDSEEPMQAKVKSVADRFLVPNPMLQDARAPIANSSQQFLGALKKSTNAQSKSYVLLQQGPPGRERNSNTEDLLADTTLQSQNLKPHHRNLNPLQDNPPFVSAMNGSHFAPLPKDSFNTAHINPELLEKIWKLRRPLGYNQRIPAHAPGEEFQGWHSAADQRDWNYAPREVKNIRTRN
ncbi:histone-lysine N-methyltransferase 2D-like [Hippoglossus hippoglossus]|uniref:histone-lysine N-methyltransferase 2D-like n=1 Tax=Hippoglossus hippoglossus TaxID=8267 RepID=UPI00148BB5E5|nr:histone-lysine N-methyltransferase 2D-like [Hippoglossus hippoglossus]